MSNQLDNFFKNKLRDRSFEYDESAWEDARLLIEENEKDKRRRRWLVLFSTALLISLVGISAYYVGRGSVQPTKQLDTKKSIAENISQEDVLTETVSLSSTQIGNTDNTETKESLETPHKKSTKSDIANEKALKTATSANTSKRVSSQAENTNNVIHDTNEIIQNATGAAGIKQSSNTPITTTYNPRKDAAVSLKQSNIVASTNQNENKLPILTFLSNEVSYLEYKINNDLTELLPELNSNAEATPLVSTNKNWIFGLRGATAVAPTAFNSFDGGVFVQYNFNRNFSLSLQPHYTYQELVRQSPEGTITTNAFGAPTSSFSLSPESIRSIHAPLLVSYAFGSRNLDLTTPANKRFLKHRLSAGISYVYLDGITASISENEPSGATADIENGWLDSTSFNRHNTEILFGYEYYITKRFSLGTMLRYRTRNQFSDTFLQQNRSLEQTSPMYLGLQALFRLN